LQERIELVVVEEQEKPGGVSISWPVLISLVLHSAFILWFIFRPQQTSAPAKDVPMVRYVELMQQNQPKEFVEAPGPAVDRQPLNAPLSDANRNASMPEPTGLNPTTRPGDGGERYTPPMPQEAPRAQQRPQPMQPQQPQQQQQASAASPGAPAPRSAQPQTRGVDSETFIYRESSKAAQASAQIDWRSAIKEVRGPVGGGGGGPDFGAAGGERGNAEQGPLSFETAWYDWGPYAQSMVSRIRVNWYANMPQLIRTGIGGVVSIQFTIHRDGRITDVAILKTSGHPPYDFAARKSIELSSPLNPLPADFPNSTERVTATFYYNTKIPS